MRKSSEGWRRSVLLLAGLLVAAPLPMRAMQTTTVQDKVYRADGTTAQGTLLVSWGAFTAADGSAVTGGSTSALIGADGSVTLTLTPNEGAEPAGTYYTAVYHLTDGTVQKEYWVVPQAATVTIAEMRTKVLPAAVAQESVSRQYVDASLSGIQSNLQNYLPLQGGALTGSLALAADPTSAMQAATKAYVDAHAGGAALPQALNVIGGKGDGSAVPVPEMGIAVDAHGNGFFVCKEDRAKGEYDARCPKYAGGLLGANPTAAFQAVEDQINCDMAMGVVNQGSLLLPPGNFGIGNITLAPGSYLSGMIDGNGSKTNLNHIWSAGTMLSMGSSYTTTCSDGQQHTNGAPHPRVEHLNLHGCGEGGCGPAPGDTNSYPASYDWTDTGLDVEALQGDAEWVQGDHFGGTAIRVGGVDSQAHHLYTLLNNEWYLFGRGATGKDLYDPTTDGVHGDVEVGGVDGQYDYIETYGTLFNPGSEYGHLAGILTGGGDSSFSHLWPQLNEIGIMQPYGHGANNRFYDFRVDFSMGEGISVADSALLFFGGLIDASCQGSNVVASLGGRCDQIDSVGQGATFLGVQTAQNPGFGASHATADWYAQYEPKILGQSTSATFQRTDTGLYGSDTDRSFSSVQAGVTGPTPDVSVYNSIVPQDTSPTTYTNLKNAMATEDIWILSGNAQVTLKDKSTGGYFQLCGGADLQLSAPGWLHFKPTQTENYGIPATITQVCAPAKLMVLTAASLPQSCTAPSLFYKSDNTGPYACGADGRFHPVVAPPPIITYASTTFNEGATGATLAGTTPATCANGCTGAWQLADDATWNYGSGGVISASAGNDPIAPAYLDVGHADYTYHLNVGNYGGGYMAMVVRYTDTLNSVFVNLTGGDQVLIYDYTNGNLTQLAQGTANFANLNLTISGATISLASDAGMTPVNATLPASSGNLTSTKLGFTFESGGQATVTGMSVTSPEQ